MEPQKTFIPALDLNNFIDRNPLTLTANTSLKKAIELMQGSIARRVVKKNRIVLVITRAGKLLGALTARDIIELPGIETKINKIGVAQVMNLKAIAARSSEITNIFDAIEIFKNANISYLPIVDEKNYLVGMVTPETIRKSLPTADLFESKTVARVMNSRFIWASCDTYLGDLIALMIKHQVSYVAIVEKNARKTLRPVGIITEGDIVRFIYSQLNLNTLVADLVMSHPLFCIVPKDSLQQADRQMQQLGLQKLVVVSETSGELLGVITQANLLANLNRSRVIKIIPKQQSFQNTLDRNSQLATFEEKSIQLFAKNDFEAKIQTLTELEKQENLLAKISVSINSPPKIKELLQETVTELKQLLKADRAIVYQCFEDRSAIAIAESVTDCFPSLLGQKIERQLELPQNGNVQILCDIDNSNGFPKDYIARLTALKITACLVAPLISNEKLWGLLAVEQCSGAREWQPEEVQSIAQLAARLAIAIQQAERDEQLQNELTQRHKPEAETDRLNLELELRVAERTAQLNKAIQDLQNEISERSLLEKKLKQSEDKVRVILEAMADIILAVDTKDYTIKITSKDRCSNNFQIREYIDLTICEFFREDPLNHNFLNQIERVLKNQIPANFEYSLALDDSQIWFIASISPISETAVVWVARDISDRKLGEEKLQQTNQKLASQLEQLERQNQDMIRLGNIIKFLQLCSNLSQAYEGLAEIVYPLFPNTVGGVFIKRKSDDLLETIFNWGQEKNKQIGLAVERILSNKNDLNRDSYYQYSCNIEARNEFFCLSIVSDNKTTGILYFTIPNPKLFSDSKRQLTIAVAEQISLGLSNLKLRETLEYQSIRDPLTTLFNRRYLEEYLDKEISISVRHNTFLGIILLDIDHFKQFNDTFGHDAGDEVLRRVSKFIQLNIRRSDIACRYGGEELITILPGANLEQTHQRAEQIRQGIKNLNLEYLDRSLGTITVSIGVSSFPQHGATPEVLIKAADIALYQAKIQGRDRVVLAI